MQAVCCAAALANSCNIAGSGRCEVMLLLLPAHVALRGVVGQRFAPPPLLVRVALRGVEGYGFSRTTLTNTCSIL